MRWMRSRARIERVIWGSWLHPSPHSGPILYQYVRPSRAGYGGAMHALITLMLALLSPLAFAGPVSVSQGTVSLMQIKAETAKVPATISGVTGSVDLSAGTGELTIPVSAWDSQLEIRNTNVRTAFFEAAANPTATFKLTSLTLTDGQGEAKGTLEMFSGSVPVQATVKVSTDEAGQTQVVTTEPFEVSISALGLSEQLKALMKLCAHPSGNDGVAGSVALTLAKQ